MLSQQLIDELKRSGKLSDPQGTELSAAAAGGQDIERLLMERKLMSEDELLQLKGKLLGLSVVSLIGRAIPPETLTTIPKHLAERYQAIAFEREGSRVTIGLVNPTDQRVVESLEFFAREKQLSIRYAIIATASFRAALRLYEEGKRETAEAITAATEKFAIESETGERAEEAEIEEAVEKAPVTKIVSTVIRHAVEGGASDIHIEPFGKESRVRYRIDGVLRTSLVLPIALHGAIVSRIKVLASLKLDETRIPQDGRIHVKEGGREIDLRVSTLPLLDNEKIVMRILETTARVITLKDLGFRDWHIAIIDQSVHRPHGMVLLTGPTGSGKSTTLYAVLNLLNAEGVNITTLEDPIEYYARGVNQAQIRTEVGFTFAAGLRAILRQDPNVVMVGEIRDTETAELAIHAGLTGHLLFSTLHTRDVLGVVPRLIDMKVEPFLLASTLIMAEGQRLVRKICPDCKEETPVEAEVAKEIERAIAGFPPNAIPAELIANGIKLFKGRGCPKCGGGGYRGRTVIIELLVFDEELQQLIVKGFPADEAAAAAKRKGMITLHQDALLKALEGMTSYEEVLRITHE